MFDYIKRPNLNDNISTKITLIQMESREDIKGQEFCSLLTSSLNELKQPTTTKKPIYSTKATKFYHKN